MESWSGWSCYQRKYRLQTPGLPASCELCGCMEDSDVHALFACPVAIEVWSDSGVAEEYWSAGQWSATERLKQAASNLDETQMGEFLAVMWAIWNERNRIIFGQGSYRGGKGIAARAIQFVRGFVEFKSQSLSQGGNEDHAWKATVWRPPDTGILRLNFDAGLVGERGYGWGFVVRNHLGDIMLMGVKQGDGFSDLETEEARACLFALRCTMAHGFRRLEVEGDCLSLVGRLKSKAPPNNPLGYFISDILTLVGNLDFIVWKFIKRGGNNVAHAIAHLQPFDYSERVWMEGGPPSIHDLASADMCKFIELSII